MTDAAIQDLNSTTLAASPADELYCRAIAVVLENQKVSTSFIQRHLQIGYNSAAALIERMEKDGIVTAADHVGKRALVENGTIQTILENIERLSQETGLRHDVVMAEALKLLPPANDDAPAAPILPTVQHIGPHGTVPTNDKDPTDQGQPAQKKGKKPKKKADPEGDDGFDIEGHGPRLIEYLEELEKLATEKADFTKQYKDGLKGITDDIKDAYGRAALDGFDTEMIDELLQLRKLDAETRAAREKAKIAKEKKLARYKKAAGLEQLELPGMGGA